MNSRLFMGVLPVCYRCTTVGTPSYYRRITVAVPGAGSISVRVRGNAATHERGCC